MSEPVERYPGQRAYLAKIKEEAKPLYTRLEYIDRIRVCYIMYKDIPICILQEESCSLDGVSSWAFRPLWDKIDECKIRYGYDVILTGIDLDKRKNTYYRRFLPGFVDQRIVNERRSDLKDRLAEIGLTYWDPFEMMCRTHGVTGNTPYYVSRTPDKVIDITDINFPYDIPEESTSDYGWLPKMICTIEETPD